MVGSFKYFLSQGKAKRKTADPEEATALLLQAEERLDYAKVKPITEKTAKFVMEDSYEAMRESAQAIMSIKGFKPYSHEATISFIQDYCKDMFSEEEIYSFDKFRKLRNDSIYKAVEITETNARECLAFAKNFVKKATTIFRKISRKGTTL